MAVSVPVWKKPTYHGTRYVSVNSLRNSFVSFVDGGAQEEASNLKITISVPLKINFGEHLKIVGSDSTLGSWCVNDAPQMEWTEGDIWSLSLELPQGFESEFKLVHCLGERDVVVWEYTPNKTLKVPKHVETTPSGPIAIALQWCDETVQQVCLDDWTKAEGTGVQESLPPSAEGNGALAPEEPVSQGQETIAPEILVHDKETEMEKSSQTFGKETEEADEAMAHMDTQQDESVARSESTTEIVEEASDAIIEKEQEKKESGMKNIAKTAGYVAAGVAGAALLSTFAVDVIDVSVVGAFAVAAGSAALGSQNMKKSKSDEDQSEEQLTDVTVEKVGVSDTKVSSEPGTIIAAGLLSAWEAGKAATSNDSDTQGDDSSLN